MINIWINIPVNEIENRFYDISHDQCHGENPNIKLLILGILGERSTTPELIQTQNQEVRLHFTTA